MKTSGPASALDALRRGCDLKLMLSEAQAASHKQIVTFQQLRDEVYNELCNVDQVAGIKDMLGDGDSATYSTIVDSKPYGDECVPKKLECIGHVQKRVGSRLRRLKNTYKGTKLSDGKGLAGKGRLTDGKIDVLQNYYGLANVNECLNARSVSLAMPFQKMVSMDTAATVMPFVGKKGFLTDFEVLRGQPTDTD
ncbi:Hypothetical predicted protein, partial [Paramuricea clavata]